MILALDFDGVICDSVREHATSSWFASYHTKGQNLENSSTIPKEFYEFFGQKRPYLEVGYQGVEIALEYREPTTTQQTEREQLADSLAHTRDRRYQADQDKWCNESPFYHSTGSALKRWLHSEKHTVWIITKKRKRYAEALLKHNGIDLPTGQLHALEDGAKEKRLLTLRASFPNESILFVEDRLETLERVQQNPELNSIELGFASWGYSDEEQKLRARNNVRVEYLQIEDFISK